MYRRRGYSSTIEEIWFWYLHQFQSLSIIRKKKTTIVVYLVKPASSSYEIIIQKFVGACEYPFLDHRHSENMLTSPPDTATRPYLPKASTFGNALWVIWMVSWNRRGEKRQADFSQCAPISSPSVVRCVRGGCHITHLRRLRPGRRMGLTWPDGLVPLFALSDQVLQWTKETSYLRRGRITHLY